MDWREDWSSCDVGVKGEAGVKAEWDILTSDYGFDGTLLELMWSIVMVSGFEL